MTIIRAAGGFAVDQVPMEKRRQREEDLLRRQLQWDASHIEFPDAKSPRSHPISDSAKPRRRRIPPSEAGRMLCAEVLPVQSGFT
jgi:hypothetical protein